MKYLSKLGISGRWMMLTVMTMTRRSSSYQLKIRPGIHHHKLLVIEPTMELQLSKLTSPTMAMLFVWFVPPLWNQWNILKDTWSQCTVRLVFTVLNVDFQRLLKSSCKVIKDLTKLMSVLIVANFYHSEMVWMKTYSTSYFTPEKSRQTSCWVRTVISGSESFIEGNSWIAI